MCNLVTSNLDIALMTLAAVYLLVHWLRSRP